MEPRAPSFSRTEKSQLIPEKLRNDAIVEAIFEIRFSTSTIPEVLFGRISEFESWRDFKPASLPISQFPVALRQADPNLRYQPVIELLDEREKRAVRIGSNVISYSRGMPYIGWKAFKTELNEVITGVFQKARDLSIERLGLRYLNALRNDLHGIGSISDLNLVLEIASERITESVNVNITTDRTSETATTVRIATMDIVQGNLPPGTSVYVDVDVFTDNVSFETKDHEFVRQWIERAHSKEKAQFFRLLTEGKIESLTEK
jgi:uncharacterized protein (TIGR04255 family)